MYMVPLTLIATLRFIFVKEDTSIDSGKHVKVDLKMIFTMMKKNKYAWMYAGIIFLFNTITSMGTATANSADAMIFVVPQATRKASPMALKKSQQNRTVVKISSIIFPSF